MGQSGMYNVSREVHRSSEPHATRPCLPYCVQKSKKPKPNNRLTMVTTRKRKVSSPDAKSKKAAKTAEEELSSPLPSSAEENEQQQQVEEEDQKDQVFVEEEDSPTKKMAAANVLIALTGAVGGDADGEGIDEDESNGTYNVYSSSVPFFNFAEMWF